MPTLTLPGPGRTLQRYTTHPPRPLPQGRPPFNRVALAAAHIVADPLSDRPAIDWDATIDYRLYLWSLGLGVAEATDIAQRGAGLDWPASLELIRRSLAAAPPGAILYCAASTDHLPPNAPITQIVGAYEAQCESIEKLGGRVILLASRALAACARGPDDYKWVYGRVLAQTRAPALLHFPAETFDPALATHWHHPSIDDALGTCLDIVTANAAKVDGIALALHDPAREVALRRHLPRGVRLYTGDELNFPDLIAGDDDGYAHAFLGILDIIAPVAAAALACLQRDEVDAFHDILAPTLPLSQHLLRPSTGLARAGPSATGIVFMAYLNGHQTHFTMAAGQHAARSLPYLAELFRLADTAGLLRDPDDAALRMARILGGSRYRRLMTTLSDFCATLAAAAPNPADDLAIQALWWTAKGDWDRAHGCVQQREGVPHCDWIHAHLHRLEGDDTNAAYWYHRAGRASSTLPLAAEWDAIATELLR